MKKIAFFLFLLSSNLSYSQGTFAKDTLSFPSEVIRAANLDYNTLNQCEEERDSLQSTLKNYRDEKQTWVRLMQFLNQELSDQRKVIDNQTGVIFAQDKNSQDCQKKYVRMLRFKNIEVVGILGLSGYLFWRVNK